METLCEEMDLCAYLRADPLVCHPRSFGLDVSTWAHQGELKLSREDRSRIGVILKEAADRSLRLALENGPSDLLANVLEAMSDHPAFEHLGICVDTGHAHMHSRLSVSPTLEFLRTFRNYLIHLHLHDNQGEEDEHLVPGSGTIEWAEVFKELAENRYCGQFVFELAGSDPDVSAEQAKEFVQDHLHNTVS
jgi:sugar phosphate isomerase/epimerase